MGRGARRPEGKCRICGIVGPLSWEHVPPEAAYNKHRTVRAARDQMLKSELWDGARGHVQQRGSGGYTLCERCNNNTGTWYGGEYAARAQQGLERLLRIPAHETDPFYVPFRGRPLRFLKQVLAMFSSVNGEKFASFHPELVKFVLDCSATGGAPKYKVDLVLVRGGFARSAGVFDAVDTAPGAIEVASEVAHYPFALRLLFSDGRSVRRGPMEHFAQFGPDEVREVWLYTVAGHVTTRYRGDYRSREQVSREAAESHAEARQANVNRPNRR